MVLPLSSAQETGLGGGSPEGSWGEEEDLDPLTLRLQVSVLFQARQEDPTYSSVQLLCTS